MRSSDRCIDVAEVLRGRKSQFFSIGLLLMSWGITMLDGFDMMTISYVAPYLKSGFHLTNGEISSLFAAGSLGMLFGGIFFAFVGDRFGRRPTILFAIACFGILTCSCALARGYADLLTLRFLDGLALGGVLPLICALNIELALPSARATVVTVIMVGYTVGSSMAAPITNLLAPHYGWRGVYLAGGVASICCVPILLAWLPESARFLSARSADRVRLSRLLNRLRPELHCSASDNFVLTDEPPPTPGFPLRRLFQNDLGWITPFVWVGYFASSIAIYGMTNWGPIVLETLNIPRSAAANIIGMGSLLGAVAGLILMRLTDRIGSKAVALYPLFAALTLIFIGLGSIPSGMLQGALLVAAALITGSHFGMISISGLYYPSAVRATGAGWASSVAKGGAIVGPILGGMMISAGGAPEKAFLWLAASPLVLACSALAIAIVRRRPREGEAA